MARSLAIVWSLSLVLWGCGDDNDSPPLPTFPDDDMADTGDNNIPNDMDAGSEMDADSEEDMACEGPACDVPNIISDGECRVVYFQGVFDVEGGGVTFQGTTAERPSELSTSCSSSGAQAAEVIFAFRVSASAFVDIDVRSPDGVDWVHEVRSGECTQEATLYCRDPETSRFLARKDITYFVVVESDEVEEGRVELDLEFTSVVCDEPGSRTCGAGAMVNDIIVCEAGLAEVPYACAAACSQNACEGDICDEAIPVSGIGMYTFKGHLEAYTNVFDAKDRVNCDLDGALETPGTEIVFSLNNLTAGQIVSVDTSQDQNDNAIFILPSCSAQAECLAAEEVTDQLEWVVPQNGSYILVIDSLSELNKEFLYTIAIE